jgi:alkylation response protein AidB-like acyl-CoA dehydrogenase
VTGFAELHDDLRSVARDLLGKNPAPDVGVMADAGWLGLEVPEALGGAGATFAETVVILEELGRVTASTPFLGTVLGVGALLAVAPGPERDDLLRRVAAGETTLAVAFSDTSPRTRPRKKEQAPSFEGSFDLVVDAPGAATVLVVLDDQLVVGGVEVEEQAVLDETRRFGTVTPTGEPRHVWPLDDPEALARRAALAVTADSLGLAGAMLEATVAYAKEREQFGRAIGSFQAVQHACADMLVATTVSRGLLATAVAGRDPRHTAMAKSHVTGVVVDVVGKALQLHGGIGYTWESGIHRYLKRAALNRDLFGSPRAHRATLITERSLS